MDAVGSPRIDVSPEKIKEYAKEFVRENPDIAQSTDQDNAPFVNPRETSVINKNLLGRKNTEDKTLEFPDKTGERNAKKEFKLDIDYDDSPIQIEGTSDKLELGFNNYASVTFKPKAGGGADIEADSKFVRDYLKTEVLNPAQVYAEKEILNPLRETFGKSATDTTLAVLAVGVYAGVKGTAKIPLPMKYLPDSATDANLKVGEKEFSAEFKFSKKYGKDSTGNLSVSYTRKEHETQANITGVLYFK